MQKPESFTIVWCSRLIIVPLYISHLKRHWVKWHWFHNGNKAFAYVPCKAPSVTNFAISNSWSALTNIFTMRSLFISKRNWSLSKSILCAWKHSNRKLVMSSLSLASHHSRQPYDAAEAAEAPPPSGSAQKKAAINTTDVAEHPMVATHARASVWMDLLSFSSPQAPSAQISLHNENEGIIRKGETCFTLVSSTSTLRFTIWIACKKRKCV